MKKILLKKMCALVAVIAIIMTSLVACTAVDTNSDVVTNNDVDTNNELQGTRFDRNILDVQNGHPELIPNITYKEAYDYFFGNPQWRGFEADTGEDVVEFSGECTYYDEDAEVYIQFVIEDDESFSMYYAGLTVGDEQFDADEYTFMELVYNPFEAYSEEVLGVELDPEVQEVFEQMFASLE